MAGRDELLADAEGPTTSIVLDKNNGTDRAGRTLLLTKRHEELEGLCPSSAPSSSTSPIKPMSSTQMVSASRISSPRGRVTIISRLLLSPVTLFVLAVAHTHEVTHSVSISTPTGPTLPIFPYLLDKLTHPFYSAVLADEVRTRDAGDEAYVCPLHCLRTPVNEERKVAVRATMNRTRQEGLSGTRGDVKIGADEVLRRRVQAKDTDAMVAPVKNVKGSEVLSSFPSASARRKAAATLHSEGCWVVMCDGRRTWSH
ncbi:hypothetical protein F5J12DRAFT_956658 [Pisolithus orientalis]|uniref:uncharacterized protein n=1 Tax=Pisolithus orientalis TaxID=936130 RepID=UPI002224BB7C|nr:uncharacterized protein F5J12DRAFT_956658 [Pisolithus orientalis]KAI5997657.1 hypothetical protein F5J12DRAFT_956658 [Pisolithus orientalis]